LAPDKRPIANKLPVYNLRLYTERGILRLIVELKPLEADQLDAVVELDRRALGGMWTLNGYQREIDSPNSDLLILCTATAVLGCGCLWSILEEAHITTLAIDPTVQRQGLGLVLLHALLESARRRGLEWATLEVRVTNQRAIALYQRFGFESVGERKKYYQDTGENALILWRKGIQKPEFGAELQKWGMEIGDRLQKSGWDLQRNVV
jgi:[ribosomal protein S18]-alanine N-acetyltransferase